MNTPTKSVTYRLPVDLLAALVRYVQQSGGRYRNVTHAVETAIRRLIEEGKQS